MVHNIPDITPAGTATPLASQPTRAAWVLITAGVSNAGTVRVGDTTTGAASGAPILGSGSVLFPSQGATNPYDLSIIKVYGTGSDSVAVVYGRL